MRHVIINHHGCHHTPNQDAWSASSCSRGSALWVSSGMTGELYPNTNPKLMGPRTDANVARYKFLFLTLLWRNRGTEKTVGGKRQSSVSNTIKGLLICLHMRFLHTRMPSVKEQSTAGLQQTDSYGSNLQIVLCVSFLIIKMMMSDQQELHVFNVA